MRRSVAVAIALVAVLIASALVAVPGTVRAAPARAGAAHPAATDTISTRTGYGGFTTSFETGLSSGDVYFYATDPTADTTVTVAINDYNATRDGLTNPVATVTAHLTGGVNASYNSHTFLAIPIGLAYPGTWNITVSGTAAGFSFQNFTVQTYYVTTQDSAYPALVLPGHSFGISYYVFSTVNQYSPYQHIGAVTVVGDYWTGTVFAHLPGTPQSLGSANNGTYTLQTPTNASANGYVDLWFYANTTGSSVWSESSYDRVYIAELGAPVVHLAACATGCFTSTFSSGEPVIVTVGEMIQSAAYGYTGPAVGATLSVLYESGSTPLTSLPGAPPTKLTTDANGRVQWIFTASTGTGDFSTTGANTLSITPSDPSIPTNKGPTTNTTFYVQKTATSAPGVQVLWGAAQYYGGDTVFSNWTLAGNSSVTQGWNGTFWYAIAYPVGGASDVVLAQGETHGTSGELSFTAPLGFNGYVYEYVIVVNATTYTYGYSGTVMISPPQVLLSANEPVYSAGDTVTVSVTTLGSVLSGATLQALVIDSQGTRLVSGPLSGSSISVSVPSTAPPTYIEFTVFAVNGTGATITNATLYVDLADGYDVSVGLSTKSSYSDDSYQPGQTIQISYSIVAKGYYNLPKAWTIWLWPASWWEGDGTGAGATQFQSMGSSGTLSYTIPSGTPNGITTLWLEAEPSSGGRSASNGVSVNVQSNPSGLGLELGAGSGLTVGWLILLIVIIIVAIVLFLALRGRGGRPKMMKPEGGSPSSGGAPQSWQESSPPSGATGGSSTPPASPPSGGSS